MIVQPESTNVSLIRYLPSSESSYSQKLIVEHTRYQDLQQKCQRMEEDYENQLKSAEAGRIQSLEELRQVYETKLEEKTQQLSEVGPEEARWCPPLTLIDVLVSALFVPSVRRNPSSTAAGSNRLYRQWRRRRNERSTASEPSTSTSFTQRSRATPTSRERLAS